MIKRCPKLFAIVSLKNGILFFLKRPMFFYTTIFKLIGTFGAVDLVYEKKMAKFWTPMSVFSTISSG